ncbi:zinc finger protein 287-like [Topomyia yanbarensis]|uniref:zinc finger protein 287-like n=1 Tax=Topomyia yanbarensis TaxID=2498891 RepID=UPI00273AFDB6|nr:zinc finger protein 287-like [Topomyia yanbarensis]
MYICRLCTKVITEYVSVFARRNGNSLAEMVSFVASIEITETDQLSAIACIDCVELTIDAFLYVQRVREADTLLKKSLTQESNLMGNLSNDISNLRKSFLSVDQVAESELAGKLDEVSMKEDVVLVQPPNIPDAGEVIQKMHKESDERLLDLDISPVEYLEGEPESVSMKLIGLLIESIHDVGSQKWVKIKHDPDAVEAVERTSIQSESDEENSSDEENDLIYDGPKIDGGGHIVRCCIRKCKLKFQSRHELIQHGSEVHASNRLITDTVSLFECVVCFQSFETRKSLACHLQKMIRDYRCHICNTYFDDPQQKRSHMRATHKDVRTVSSYRLEDQPVKICCGCESTFDTIEELFQHGVDTHQFQHSYANEGREKQCNICYKYFKTNTSLRNHQILVYKPKSYSCPECGKSFECPSKLSNHETTHRTERNFSCTTCGGTFKTAADLRGHQRIHQEKTLICNVCGSRFHRQAHLRSHLKTHDDQAFEFDCSLCPKKFKEKSNLKTHLKVHTREKPYQCQYCSKQFRYISDRKRHEICHTGNYPHKCSVCGKTFIRNHQRKTHENMCVSKM